MTPFIAPSILSADFAKLGQEVAALEQAGADYIHVDVMDGHFVPNLTIGAMVVKAIKPHTKLPLDVHLMINPVDPYIKDFADAGADIITVHAEAGYHTHRTIQMVKETGAKVGLSLNPATPASVLEHLLPELDLVLVMSVNPGFGGQKFIPSQIHKIKQIRGMIDALGKDILLEVDGGITPDNARQVVDAGANMLVAGTAVFKGGDYQGNIQRLKGV